MFKTTEYFFFADGWESVNITKEESVQILPLSYTEST